MVETYSTDQERFYYIEEGTPGVTPSGAPEAHITMLGIPAVDIIPSFDPNNLKLRGVGNYDLQDIKRGTFEPSLRLNYIVPSAAPTNLLQYIKRDLDKTISGQVLYYKGAFEAATDILSLLYNYLKVSKATVSFETDDLVRASLDLIGQNITTGTAKLANADYAEYSGAISQSTVTIGGVTNTKATRWSFSVENNPRRVPVIRSANPHLAKYIPWGQRSISGEIDFEFEDKTEIDQALADTEFSLALGIGGATATLSNCKWDTITKDKWLEDLISVKATFTARGLAIA